ncbi:MAG: hypothetical protein D6731_09225 [Planctomycetota bacterium]|nr:MAG: hypothetical protein D6731_09225 [Planctomycetota bacterium]
MTPLRSFLFATLLLTAGVPARAESDFEGRLTHRPRVGFDGRDAAHIARTIQRIENREEPWAGAYARLRDRAEQGRPIPHGGSGWKTKPDPYSVLYGQEAHNGEIAAAKATVAWLWTQGLDPSWRPLPRLPGEASPEGWIRRQAQEAADILDGLYDDWPVWRGFEVLDRGIKAADALVMQLAAYDLLAALPASLRPGLQRAERRLGNLASDLRFWEWLLALWRNNHTVRVASGLGMAAVVLNRHRRYRWYDPKTWWHRPKGWMRAATRRLHPTRRSSAWRHQAQAGAWAEGTSYFHYAADLALPFFSTYQRFLSGRGVPYLSSDAVNDPVAWCIGLRLPDGRRPIVDNARLYFDTTPGYFLSRGRGRSRSSADQELFLWDWKRSGYPGARGRRALFFFAADPTPTLVQRADALTAPPGTVSRIDGRRGTAVLRSGWGPDDAHALVLAQAGLMRTRGYGHEAVSNGAFTYFVHGDQVTIDPGYYGWPQVEKTNRGRHRSMVLVDGEGPRGVHRFLGFLHYLSGGTDTRVVPGARTSATGSVPSVEVESEYRGARVRRTVFLLGTRALLVEDRCEARTEKTFTAQVQLNGGTPKQRPLTRTPAGVHYETARKRLQAAVGFTASAPATITTSTRESSTGERPDGHEAVECTARGRSVRFLTAVAAAPPGAVAPEVHALRASGGALALAVVSGGETDVVVSNPAGTPVDVDPGAGLPRVRTSHALAVVRFDAQGRGRTVWTVGSGSLSY